MSTKLSAILFRGPVSTGQGTAIDTTTASGKLVFGVFGVFAALTEFERELISERT